MTDSKLTYTQSGVDYSKLDPLKIMAQAAARETGRHLAAMNYREVEASRGESAYVVDLGDFYLASILECLGTKSLVADQMRKITGKTYYDYIAQDTIASAVNDIITVGAKPVCVQAYWATSGTEWLSDEQRMRDLVDGWKRTCDQVGVAWGGGETPSMAEVVERGAVDLAASCVGVIKPKSRLTLGQELAAGDVIIMLASSGIHANGVTLARKIADRLEGGYGCKLSDGRMYGEALLDPTTIYASVMEALFEAGVNLHYVCNITGHGWRKVMRHPQPFTYRFAEVPPVPAVLRFMAEQAGIDPAEAYGSLNMGAGFALFVPEKDAVRALEVCAQCGIQAYQAGKVEAGAKRVVIEPLDITFQGESLKLRA